MIQRPGPDHNDGYIRPGHASEPLPEAAVFPGIRDVPNARRVRAVVASSVALFITGVAVLIGNSPFRNEALVPGPLSSAHAHLFRPGDADRCQACHPAAHVSGSEWLGGAVFGIEMGEDQSDLCLKCHQDLQRSGHGKLPHNVAPETLVAKRARGIASAEDSNRRSMTGPWPRGGHGAIACRDCHREHHGDVSLTSMTDRQCQVCHQQTFHSFANGHPEFSQGLVRRRSQIAFDHSSHFSRHFPEKDVTFDCRKCHTLQRDGMVVGLADYEHTCAECHDAQVQQFAERGLDFVVLPTLDLQAIANLGLDVGQWPALADGDFDGALTPMMRLLLEGDAADGEWIRELDADFNLSDVDPDDRVQVQQAVRLAWAIKSAVVDISEHGRSAVVERVSRAMRSEEIEPDQWSAPAIEPEAFRVAMAKWFPRAVVEVPLYRARREHAGRPLRLGAVSDLATNRTVQDDDRLLAPNPLRELMNRGVPDPGTPADDRRKHDDPITANDGRQTKIQDQDEGASRADDPPNRVVPTAGSPGELLAENPITEWLRSNRLPGRNPMPDVDGKGGSDGSTRAAVSGEQPQLPELDDEPRSSVSGHDEPVRDPVGEPGQTDVAVRPSVDRIDGRGGWMVDHERLAVTCQLTGHADPVWVAWADRLARSEHGDGWSAAASRLLLQADDSNACRRCHTVDRLAAGAHIVNWRFQGRDPWTWSPWPIVRPAICWTQAESTRQVLSGRTRASSAAILRR